eukprot:5957280-Pyramimonas_sp.AAC.2
MLCYYLHVGVDALVGRRVCQVQLPLHFHHPQHRRDHVQQHPRELRDLQVLALAGNLSARPRTELAPPQQVGPVSPLHRRGGGVEAAAHRAGEALHLQRVAPPTP